MKRSIAKAMKKQAPTVLSIVASVGVITTAVLSAKATPKAVKLLDEAKKDHDKETGEPTIRDTVLAAAPAYIPAAVSGILTIACIFGANVLNKRQQAAITSAYALLDNSYKQYKRKIAEIYGEDAHERIMRELAVEKPEDGAIYANSVFFGMPMCLDFEGAKEEKMLFYDSFSDRYFESTISRVLQAEYHLNRNAQLGMYAKLNDFYDLLGLEHTTTGEILSWREYGEDYLWIDFNHVKTIIDDGLLCWIIECDDLSAPTAE